VGIVTNISGTSAIETAVGFDFLPDFAAVRTEHFGFEAEEKGRSRHDLVPSRMNPISLKRRNRIGRPPTGLIRTAKSCRFQRLFRHYSATVTICSLELRMRDTFTRVEANVNL
jgi:hypothetical protein